MTDLLTRLILLLALLSSSVARSAPGDSAEAVKRAQLAMAAKRYLAAAEAMEEAWRVDPDPLWLANAGYARMMAGQLDRAIEHLSGALADSRLSQDARTRATARLANASSAKALISRAEEARTRGDFLGAARTYDEALAHLPIGPLYLLTGELFERANELELAEARYQASMAEQDLNDAQRRQAVEALARVARAIAARSIPLDAPPQVDPGDEPVPARAEPTLVSSAPPAANEPSRVLEWTLIGVGVVGIGVGVFGFVASDSAQSEFRSKVVRDPDGTRIFEGTQAEARDLERDSGNYWTLGVVATSVGVGAAAVGALLFALNPSQTPGEGTVQITGEPLDGGGLFGMRGRF